MSTQHTPKQTFGNMGYAQAIASVEMSIGRNWRDADCVLLTTFPDCARVEVYWADGAADYLLHDTVEEAHDHLCSLNRTAIAKATEASP